MKVGDRVRFKNNGETGTIERIGAQTFPFVRVKRDKVPERDQSIFSLMPPSGLRFVAVEDFNAECEVI